MMKLCREIANITQIREGPQLIKDYVNLISIYKTINTADLAIKLGIPIPIVSAIRRELEKRDIINRLPSGMSLSLKGRNLIVNPVRIQSDRIEEISEFDFRPRMDKKLLSKVRYYLEKAPSIRRDLNQTSATAETSVKRVYFMHSRFALAGKNIMILGDDDLVSITIELFRKIVLDTSNFTSEVMVLEIDKRWVEYIQYIVSKEKLSICCKVHDLRIPIPKEYRNRFDTVETDPPYTSEGFRLFVSRGTEALKQEARKDLFISFGNKSPQESLNIQKDILEMGLDTREFVRDFNRYKGATILCNRSNLYHLRTTKASSKYQYSGLKKQQLYTKPKYKRVKRSIGCSKDKRRS